MSDKDKFYYTHTDKAEMIAFVAGYLPAACTQSKDPNVSKLLKGKPIADAGEKEAANETLYAILVGLIRNLQLVTIVEGLLDVREGLHALAVEPRAERGDELEVADKPDQDGVQRLVRRLLLGRVRNGLALEQLAHVGVLALRACRRKVTGDECNHLRLVGVSVVEFVLVGHVSG